MGSEAQLPSGVQNSGARPERRLSPDLPPTDAWRRGREGWEGAASIAQAGTEPRAGESNQGAGHWGEEAFRPSRNSQGRDPISRGERWEKQRGRPLPPARQRQAWCGSPPPRQERGWEGLLSTLSQTGLTRPLRASHRCHPQQPSLAAKALDHHDCRWKWPPHTAGPLLCGGSLQGWGQHPG